MDALAAASLAGIAPADMLRADPMVRALLVEVANRAWALNVQRDDALATRVINRLADSMRK